MRELHFKGGTFGRVINFEPGTGAIEILAVGEPEQWQSIAHAAGVGVKITAKRYAEFIEYARGQLREKVVISSVVFGNDDCIDLATALNEIGFEGRYLIVGEHVSKPRLLLAELHSACPGLSIEIIKPIPNNLDG